VSDASKEVVRRHYEDGVNNGDIAVATECFAAEYAKSHPRAVRAGARHPGVGGVLSLASGRLPRHDHHARAPRRRR